jgi:hypothetical protein
MTQLWIAAALIGLALGVWAQDRWPRSLLAGVAALAGCSWFGGVCLAVLLVG